MRLYGRKCTFALSCLTSEPHWVLQRAGTLFSLVEAPSLSEALASRQRNLIPKPFPSPSVLVRRLSLLPGSTCSPSLVARATEDCESPLVLHSLPAQETNTFQFSGWRHFVPQSQESTNSIEMVHIGFRNATLVNLHMCVCVHAHLAMF